jgi:hypothetical protein
MRPPYACLPHVVKHGLDASPGLLNLAIERETICR